MIRGMGFYSEGPTRSDADCKEMQKSLKAPVAYSEKAVKDKIKKFSDYC